MADNAIINRAYNVDIRADAPSSGGARNFFWGGRPHVRPTPCPPPLAPRDL